MLLVASRPLMKSKSYTTSKKKTMNRVGEKVEEDCAASRMRCDIIAINMMCGLQIILSPPFSIETETTLRENENLELYIE